MAQQTYRPDGATGRISIDRVRAMSSGEYVAQWFCPDQGCMVTLRAVIYDSELTYLVNRLTEMHGQAKDHIGRVHGGQVVR